MKVEVRVGPLKCFEVLSLKKPAVSIQLMPVTCIGIPFCTFPSTAIGSSDTAVVHFMSSVFDLFGKYSTVL